jgi:hypothetical protein
MWQISPLHAECHYAECHFAECGGAVVSLADLLILLAVLPMSGPSSDLFTFLPIIIIMMDRQQ